jgi:SAM-dependent methyltransferase
MSSNVYVLAPQWQAKERKRNMMVSSARGVGGYPNRLSPLWTIVSRARVTGVDFAPQLLYQACARAQAEHLKIDFQTADAEALPCEGGAFDAVMSTFGVMFAPNQEQAASELLRVCRSGGKIALANWGSGDFVAELFRVSATYAPPPEGLSSPLRWGDTDMLTTLFGDQMDIVSSAMNIANYRYESAPHFVDHLRQFYGPTNKAFRVGFLCHFGQDNGCLSS